MSNQMFPRCTILYKVKDTPGWNYAIMGGNEIECKKECETLKIKNNWFSYKCYHSGSCVIKREIPFQKVTPSAYDIQLTTNLIYLHYTDKWFYPDEIMPYPQENKAISEDLDIEVKYDKDDNDCCYDTNDVEYTFVDILFTTSNQKVELFSYAEDFLNAIPVFIKDLNKNNYANLSMEELTATKFLAWKINDDRSEERRVGKECRSRWS